MSRKSDIADLIEMGLEANRLEKHSDEELAAAMCAVQESGNDAEMIDEIGDDEAAVVYAESALGW